MSGEELDFYNLSQEATESLFDCGYDFLSDPQMHAIYYITVVVFPVLLLLGLVGNLLSVPVLYYLSRTTWSALTYLLLLCGADLVVLLVRCGDGWYSGVTGVSLSMQLMGSSDAMCKTYMFVFTFLQHLIPWLLVAVSVEMVISTRWPNQLYVISTPERARNVVMLITVLLVCLDINHFWTWGAPVQQLGCRYTEDFSHSFRDLIWPALTNLVELILPFVIVCSCFVITACTMISRKQSLQKRIDAELQSYFLELPALWDFRSICLLLSMVFLCQATVKITLNVIDFMVTRDYLVLHCPIRAHFSISKKLVKTIDLMFTYIFYSCKIFLYAGYSPAFREALRHGFSLTRRRFKQIVALLNKSPAAIKHGACAQSGSGEARQALTQDDTTYDVVDNAGGDSLLKGSNPANIGPDSDRDTFSGAAMNHVASWDETPEKMRMLPPNTGLSLEKTMAVNTDV